MTTILGSPEVYVHSGSTINLTCVVANTARPPKRVEWSRDGEEVSYLGPRPGVSLVTDKAEVTVVSLIMAGATANDSGTYLCRPWERPGEQEMPVANISVHVIEGVNIHQLSRGEGRANPELLVLLLTLGLQATMGLQAILGLQTGL